MDTKPTIQDMEKEPALTIGEIFGSKTMIQPVISALVVILAGILKFTVADDLVDNLTTIVIFVGAIWGAVGANREQKKLAEAQAKETRSAVYSPATTKRLVNRAAKTGNPDIGSPPSGQ